MHEILNSLNEKQIEAVQITQGPLMVLAGAGSGKTKMMTSRICYLICELGISPHQIMAVTFTNKAANEMKERVQRTLDQLQVSSYEFPEIGTFHSVCVRLLRREHQHTAFEKPFVIYDDSDQLSLIKNILFKLNLDEKQINPKSIQSSINHLKCDAIRPAEMQPQSTSGFNFYQKRLKDIYDLYEKELLSNSAIDFGGILCQAYYLLRDHEDLRIKYQTRFQYIHVDEYQDTNRAQYLFLSLLAAPKSGGSGNICVVGDEDQSIYKWRGADIRNILEFERDFPGAKTVKLEQNYRSTQTIIEAASEVISNNSKRKEKKLWTQNKSGDPIVAYQVSDERMEAETTVTQLQLLAQGASPYSFSDFAIFYRTNAQSRQFEDVLRREKIPYQIVGGLRFYDRKEIKDILSYFRVILNTNDSLSLKRIINIPTRGIGKTTVEKIDEMELQSYASLPTGQSKHMSWWDCLVKASFDATLTSAATAKKLLKFVQMMDELKNDLTGMKLSEFYHLLLDRIKLIEVLKEENTDESFDRIANLKELNTLLVEFENNEPTRSALELLEIFLQQVSLATDIDKLDVNSGCVKLMTLHSSKGLEFSVVFLVGLEEGLFPSIKVWEQPNEEEIEEERRLFYVGMTRAKERLFLLNAQERRIWGNITFPDPSRFLKEVPKDYLVMKRYPSQKILRRPAHDTTMTNVIQLRRGGAEKQPDFGKTVQHPEYGLGRVISSEGSGEDQKVTVEFKDSSRRKFLVKYLSQWGS